MIKYYDYGYLLGVSIAIMNKLNNSSAVNYYSKSGLKYTLLNLGIVDGYYNTIKKLSLIL